MKLFSKKKENKELFIQTGRFFRLFLIYALISGCTSNEKYLVGDGGGPYKMVLYAKGGKWIAESPMEMVFRLTDSHADKPVSNLQLAHERFMHIFVTDEKFGDFAHLHARGDTKKNSDPEGLFSVPHTFDKPGFYRIVVEFVHRNRIWNKSFRVLVVASSGNFEIKNVRNQKSSKYEVSLEKPIKIIAGKEAKLAVVVKQDDLPVRRLKLFLGSELHGAVWRNDFEHFGHLHSFTPKMEKLLAEIRHREKKKRISPVQLQEALVEVMCGESQLVFSGPVVPFRYTFPTAGVYRLFLQVAPEGVPITFKSVLVVNSPTNEDST